MREGSVEATIEGDFVKFDVDLFNPYSAAIFKHGLEVSGNKLANNATNPVDALKKLNGRGVQTGVRCK